MEGATESGTAPTHHCFVLQRQLTFTSARAPGPPMRSMRALYISGNCWRLSTGTEMRSSHTARRIICSLESATSWTGSCITSAGVSVRKARAARTLPWPGRPIATPVLFAETEGPPPSGSTARPPSGSRRLPDSSELAQGVAVPEHDGSQVRRVGSVPRLRLLVQLINGVPGPGESTHLVVPGTRTLLQRLRTLVSFFAQSGTCTGPGRRTQRPAKIRTSPTRLLIIQRRTESCTSGSLVSRPTGVADGLSGPSLVAPEPEAGGMVGGPPRQVGVREGCEVVHTEVPPCRCRLEDPSFNGDPDLSRPRTEGRRDGLEHSGFEGALRCLAWCFGPEGAPVWVSPSPHPACPAASHGRGPSQGSSGAGPHHLLRQWPHLEIHGGPPQSAPPLPPGPPSWPHPGRWWWR